MARYSQTVSTLKVLCCETAGMIDVSWSLEQVSCPVAPLLVLVPHGGRHLLSKTAEFLLCPKSWLLRSEQL